MRGQKKEYEDKERRNTKEVEKEDEKGMRRATVKRRNGEIKNRRESRSAEERRKNQLEYKDI